MLPVREDRCSVPYSEQAASQCLLAAVALALQELAVDEHVLAVCVLLVGRMPAQAALFETGAAEGALCEPGAPYSAEKSEQGLVHVEAEGLLQVQS